MSKKINFTQQQIDEMINLHNQGKFNREIGKIFDTSRQTIGRILRSNGVPSRHPWLTPDRKKQICDRYLDGMNFTEIAKEIHCAEQTAKEVVLEYGIELRDYRKESMKYNIDEEYFNIIDTPNKAYVLGLFYSDGTVSKKTSTITLSLQERDVDILRKIQLDMKSNHPLVYVKLNDKNPNWSNQYSFSISNRPLHDSLIKQGVIPNKSLILKFPENLNVSLYRHFIRGYMDGDGFISKNPKEKRISMVGTRDFCEGVKNIIENELQVHCSICLCHGNSDSPTRTLRIAGGKQVKKFLDWLYEDAQLYLNRKYKVYNDLYCVA